jgi:two-component system, response regulator
MMPNERIFDLLLVEDNPSDVELTLRAFKKSNFLNPVLVVEDGQAALDFIFCREAYAGRKGGKLPRIILLDLKLPKVSGFDVLKAIKSDEMTKSIPIVILTSSHEDPDIRTAYDLGANGYVIKPVEFSAFVSALNNIGFYWLLMNESQH